tara:strand:+ start:1378 stop:1800 length:423 start_codon:yes stop_codon:yes gene_type:complete
MKMGWESAKRDLEKLYRNGQYANLSIESHSSYYILPDSFKDMTETETTEKHKPAFAKNELRKVHQVDYHRNGIGGHGFYSVRYDWADYDGVERRMLATIPDSTDNWTTECRVIDIDEPETSWRGDSLAPKIINMIERSKQ